MTVTVNTMPGPTLAAFDDVTEHLEREGWRSSRKAGVSWTAK
jgi:hypothetical protein